MLGKAVRQHLQQSLSGYGVGIDIDFTKLAVGTDIVHAAHVVVVGMGNQNTVNLAEGLWHNLLPEVRATVDKQSGGIGLDKGRAAQTLVTRIWAGAGMTLAADGGNATRSSCP